MLSLGNNLSKKTGVVAPGVVRDSLAMEHKFAVGAVQPLSDGAAYFDSTDDYIDLGTKANTGSDLTFTAWVHFTDNGVQPLIYYGDFLVQFSDASTFRVWADASNGASSAAHASIQNEWHHIAAVVDSNDVLHYLDGVYLETDTLADGLSTDSNASSALGKQSTNFYGGYMCNVGLWSRVLTQAEIKSIMWKQYADLTTSEKTSLVSFWNLDDLPQASNSYRLGTNKGHIYYSEGASDHGSNIAIKEFLPGNGLELGSDVFGGEGSFSSDTGYWSLSNDTTISNGVVITDSGSGNYNGIAKSSILTAGKIYKLSFDVIEANTPDTLIRLNWGDYTDAADDAYPVIWSNTSGSTDTTGSYYIYFEPGANTATTFIIYVSQSGTGNYAEVKLDNIVCQEVSNPGEPK